jgi:hypothetical protein
MFNTIGGVGAVRAGAGAASRYGSGSDQKLRLLAAPAPQHRVYYTIPEEEKCVRGGHAFAAEH